MGPNETATVGPNQVAKSMGHSSIGPSLDQTLAEGFIASLVGFVFGIHFPQVYATTEAFPKIGNFVIPCGKLRTERPGRTALS